MKYIRSVLNGGTSYSVFEKKIVSEGRIIDSYGICIENNSESVYIPDITTVKDIAMCMIKVLSTERIMPDKIEKVICSLIS